MGITNNESETTSLGLNITGVYYTCKGATSVRKDDNGTRYVRAVLYKYANKSTYDANAMQLSHELKEYEISTGDLDTNILTLFYNKVKVDFTDYTDE